MWGMRETSPLSSSAPICSESAGGALFTLLCVCVCEEGGRKKGRAARRREWRDGRAGMEEGEDSR